MAALGARASVAVSGLGKINTTLQMVSILLLVAFTPYTSLSWIGVAALYGASLLTFWSMVLYLKAAWPLLGDDL
jgi:CDP-diacylglycerol--glycerol-3-phosphate 3-phosphatidyltransferase